jgi:hypothetical protein
MSEYGDEEEEDDSDRVSELMQRELTDAIDGTGVIAGYDDPDGDAPEPADGGEDGGYADDGESDGGGDGGDGEDGVIDDPDAPDAGGGEDGDEEIDSDSGQAKDADEKQQAAAKQQAAGKQAPAQGKGGGKKDDKPPDDPFEWLVTTGWPIAKQKAPQMTDAINKGLDGFINTLTGPASGGIGPIAIKVMQVCGFALGKTQEPGDTFMFIATSSLKPLLKGPFNAAFKSVPPLKAALKVIQTIVAQYEKAGGKGKK